MLYVTAAGLPPVLFRSSPLHLRHAFQSATQGWLEGPLQGKGELFASLSGGHAH